MKLVDSLDQKIRQSRGLREKTQHSCARRAALNLLREVARSVRLVVARGPPRFARAEPTTRELTARDSDFVE